MSGKAPNWVLGLTIVVLVLFALALGIGDATNVGVALAALAVVALLVWPRAWPRVDVVAIRVLGAVVVAALAVVGANVIFNLIDELLGSGESRLPILVGVGAAMVVFAFAAFWYGRWSGLDRKWSAIGGAALAILVIAGLPVLYGVLTTDTDKVPVPETVPARLDLMIVTDGSPHAEGPELPPLPTAEPFDVSYSVGVADGEGVRWTLVNEADRALALRAVAEGRRRGSADALPIRRDKVDAALILLPDGTPGVVLSPADLPEAPPQPGELRRWKRVAAAAAPPGTAVFAVLQAGERGRRIKQWRSSPWLEDAVPARTQAQTIADTGQQLAVSAATAREDYALALAYRPVLLFDPGERYRTPLSIDALFKQGLVTLCDDRGLTTECAEEPLRGPRELVNGGTHIELDLDAAGKPPSAPPGLGTAIYVHPVSVDRGRKHLLFLDYWWYLAGNPVDVGGGALCGAGLVIPGITCQSHESDWEGVTVVVNRTGAEPTVEAVHYAQHDSIVRYPWQSLRERWRKTDAALLAPPLADLEGRPLVFVARGTHASYPEPCKSDCKQVASGLGEGAHRGSVGWSGNDTASCVETLCLLMLPTTEGGERPALWNAYTGQWGARHCDLTYYCDSGSPPTAPGDQGRYEEPTLWDHTRKPRA